VRHHLLFKLHSGLLVYLHFRFFTKDIKHILTIIYTITIGMA